MGDDDDQSWDRVWSVGDYYDGPRSGVADVDGVPHIYQCEYPRSDDDVFRLAPIDPDLFALECERHAIYCRWDIADRAHRVHVGFGEPRVLPEDRARYDQITRLIGDRLELSADQGFLRRARFHEDCNFATEADTPKVRWLPVG